MAKGQDDIHFVGNLAKFQRQGDQGHHVSMIGDLRCRHQAWKICWQCSIDIRIGQRDRSSMEYAHASISLALEF